MRARLYAGLAVLLSTVAAGAQSIPFDMTPELGRPAASGQPQTQPSQGTNPQPLPTVADRQRRYLLPFPEFVLSGETARRSWAIYLTQQEAASPAGLRIGYQNAVVVAPEISHLVLSINGNKLVDTQIKSSNGTAELGVDIPANLLHQGLNEIVVEAQQRHRTDCTVASTYELWTRFDPAKTFLTFQDQAAGRWKSVEDIRAVGVDEKGGTSFLLVAPSMTQTPATVPVVRLAEVLATLSNMPNQTFALREKPDAPARAGQAVAVVGPAADIQQYLPALPPGATTAPVSAMVDDPNGGPSTLVVTGPNWQAVGSAVEDIAKVLDRPATSQRTSLATQTWHMPDVPLFFEAGLKTFSELGVATQEFSGRRFRTDFMIGMPADFYADSYGHVTLLLDAAYSQDVLPGSHIDVYVNGNIAATMPITSTGGEILRHLPINVTMRHFRPGDNSIAIEAVLQTKSDAVCAPGATGSGSSRFVLFDSSELVVPAFARIGRTPNLSAVSGNGFPYGRAGEPVPLIVDNSEPKALSAAASLLARMSVAAGRPIPVKAATASGATTDRDAIFVGAVSQIPATVLAQLGIAGDVALTWGEATSPAGTNTDATFDEWRQRLRGSGWRGQVSMFEDWLNRTFNFSFSSLRLIPRSDRPFSPPGGTSLLLAQQASPDGFGTWTVATAPNADLLQEGVDALAQQTQWRQLSGRIAALDVLSHKVTTEPVVRFGFVQTQPFSISNYRLIVANWLSANALAYSVALAVLSILLGLATAGLLASLGRRP
ncbi:MULTISPECIES: cellulose biosynthesis cyclic di-GMP-binding regulatory protein BcsB [Phyllobacteriaceae]|jgi:hypothetical protein|uniref:Cyclic di-GMP-binding protein n=2 Tax=Pseudomonadota TaxID=1224 RepID=A0A1C2DIE0_9HYPH|nr:MULTISPECIES: cellulose biosynthesis cyclic di-GMP-binding regulatory protein BcsB [Mesorhizobium]MBN9234422.1 cellulose biosynthesis cyclic di-GMP-binding regulatory protein BcsB [Mesorhizobium sp.]MDQ0332487.1 hypothetical protein [Mesorhizobium sp. YL-MeA3-2017]OCX14497.1 hypothetical protein QV13_18695 [Mesorhizobium hungaricum]